MVGCGGRIGRAVGILNVYRDSFSVANGKYHIHMI